MKRQILLGLSALMIVGTVNATTISGSGSGRAAACASAKNTIIRNNFVVTSECTCDAPRYEGGDWRCYVDSRPNSSSSSSSSSDYSSMPGYRSRPYILQGQP